MKVVKERIAYLRQHGSDQMIHILNLIFDPNVKFVLPEGPMPEGSWKSLPEATDMQGMLYAEARRLYIFTEGGNPNLRPKRREQLWVNLLESVTPVDADLLISMKDKKFPSWNKITKKQFEEAFPGRLHIDWSKKFD